jgi:hypothetical protein
VQPQSKEPSNVICQKKWNAVVGGVGSFIHNEHTRRQLTEYWASEISEDWDDDAVERRQRVEEAENARFQLLNAIFGCIQKDTETAAIPRPEKAAASPAKAKPVSLEALNQTLAETEAPEKRDSLAAREKKKMGAIAARKKLVVGKCLATCKKNPFRAFVDFVQHLGVQLVLYLGFCTTFQMLVARVSIVCVGYSGEGSIVCVGYSVWWV